MSRQSPAVRFNKLINETVNKTYDGPIPEVLLCRLLSVAEAVFREELQIDPREQELAGLRLGYALENEVPKDTEGGAKKGITAQKLYWVGWGWHPMYDMYDGLLKPKKASSSDHEKHPTLDTSSTGLSASALKSLISQFQKEMIRRTPPLLLEGKIVRPFVFGHTIKLNAGRGPNPFALEGEIGGGEIVTPRLEASSIGCCNCNCATRGTGEIDGVCQEVNVEKICVKAPLSCCWNSAALMSC